MSFGGGSTPLPQPQPVVPVPQPDDPKLLESQRRAALAAQGREGYSAHLLAKDDNPDTAMGADEQTVTGGQARLIA
jgi:hypothetical protein